VSESPALQSEPLARRPRGLDEPPVSPAPPMAPETLAWFIALIGWTAALGFFCLRGGADFEPTDCWVSQTAREMREGGNWIVPRFSGETRMQKSPGAYWAVILASWFRGTPVDEAATRVPNVFAALLVVVSIFWLTRRIHGDRAAVFAGFAASSSTLTLYWSHRGASDLGTTAFMTLALAALWIACDSEPPGRRRIAILLLGYFSAGMGMLYKMPMPLVCVGIPALLYMLLQNRWRFFASRWHLVGLLLFCLPWLPWVVSVLLLEPAGLAKWRVEYFDRFTGDLPNVEEQKQWRYTFYYLQPIIIYTVPYTLSLLPALLRGWRLRSERPGPGSRFAMLWFGGLLLFFTAAVGKETRYLLPAIPPLFVLLGPELAAFFDPNRIVHPKRDRRLAQGVWVLMPIGFAAGTLAFWKWYRYVQIFEWSDIWPRYALFGILFTAGCGFSAWLYLKRREHVAFGVLVGTMWVSWMWLWAGFMPLLATQAPSRDFAVEMNQRIPAEMRNRLRMIGPQDSRLTWYGDLRFPRIIDQLDLLKMQGGRRSLAHERQIVGEEMVRRLRGAEPVLFVAMRVHYIEFLLEAPRLLADRGETMPAVHLWIQTRLGTSGNHYVVFGNVSPPWPEPALQPRSERLAAASQPVIRAPASSQPAVRAPASR